MVDDRVVMVTVVLGGGRTFFVACEHTPKKRKVNQRHILSIFFFGDTSSVTQGWLVGSSRL